MVCKRQIVRGLPTGKKRFFDLGPPPPPVALNLYIPANEVSIPDYSFTGRTVVWGPRCYSRHHLPLTSPSHPLPSPSHPPPLPLTSPSPRLHLPQVLQVHKDEVSIMRGGGSTADIEIDELELIGTWNNCIGKYNRSSLD